MYQADHDPSKLRLWHICTVKGRLFSSILPLHQCRELNRNIELAPSAFSSNRNRCIAWSNFHLQRCGMFTWHVGRYTDSLPADVRCTSYKFRLVGKARQACMPQHLSSCDVLSDPIAWFGLTYAVHRRASNTVIKAKDRCSLSLR